MKNTDLSRCGGAAFAFLFSLICCGFKTLSDRCWMFGNFSSHCSRVRWMLYFTPLHIFIPSVCQHKHLYVCTRSWINDSPKQAMQASQRNLASISRVNTSADSSDGNVKKTAMEAEKYGQVCALTPKWTKNWSSSHPQSPPQDLKGHPGEKLPPVWHESSCLA